MQLECLQDPVEDVDYYSNQVQYKVHVRVHSIPTVIDFKGATAVSDFNFINSICDISNNSDDKDNHEQSETSIIALVQFEHTYWVVQADS